jgi:uncharacterized protein (DUF2225 family)
MSSSAATVPTHRPKSLSSLKVQLRWVPTGNLLCREGDPPGPLYLICAGSMRVYRHDAEPPHREIDIARVGTGDVIGELAPILNKPRSASVQALEPTQVLEIDVRDIGSIVEQQAPLRRVLGLALQERSGLPSATISAMAARFGISLPTAAPSPAQASSEAPAAPTFPDPAHDTTVAYPKPLTCPACGARFSALAVRPKKDMPGERATDLHQTYRTALNPYDYEVWVCPNDLYAGFATDFADLAERFRPHVANVVQQVVDGWGGTRPDFNVDRTLALREKALELALAMYRLRQATPLRLGAIMHRLAWAARERGDEATERAWLAQAVEAYATGYRDSDLEKKEELRIGYLCGELHLRLGALNDALQWFGEGLRHPALTDHPTWERMIRDQWAAAREIAAANAQAGAE